MTRKNPGKLVPNELVDAPWEEVKKYAPINYREFIDALWVAVKGVLEVDGVRGRSHREDEE